MKLLKITLDEFNRCIFLLGNISPDGMFGNECGTCPFTNFSKQKYRVYSNGDFVSSFFTKNRNNEDLPQVGVCLKNFINIALELGLPEDKLLSLLVSSSKEYSCKEISCMVARGKKSLYIKIALDIANILYKKHTLMEIE